jgi:hypothetical protein
MRNEYHKRSPWCVNFLQTGFLFRQLLILLCLTSTRFYLRSGVGYLWNGSAAASAPTLACVTRHSKGGE